MACGGRAIVTYRNREQGEIGKVLSAKDRQAFPEGQVPTNADSVVFEASQHDYPQIVGYRRSGRDSVLAWIDGTRGGKPQRIEFPDRRVVCPSPNGAK